MLGDGKIFKLGSMCLSGFLKDIKNIFALTSRNSPSYISGKAAFRRLISVKASASHRINAGRLTSTI